MFLRDGILFDINRAHEFDGYQYPRGYFRDPDARTRAGIVEIPDPEYPDPRFYTFVQNPDGSLTVTPRLLDEVRETLKAEVANKRFAVETGGIAIAGVRVGTDKEDQAAVTGAMMTLQLGFVTAIDWKGANGWINVTLGELTPIAQAVAKHVQTCFSVERAKCAQIDAAQDIDELQQISIENDWPDTEP